MWKYPICANLNVLCTNPGSLDLKLTPLPLSYHTLSNYKSWKKLPRANVINVINIIYRNFDVIAEKKLSSEQWKIRKLRKYVDKIGPRCSSNQTRLVAPELEQLQRQCSFLYHIQHFTLSLTFLLYILHTWLKAWPALFIYFLNVFNLFNVGTLLGCI